MFGEEHNIGGLPGHQVNLIGNVWGCLGLDGEEWNEDGDEDAAPHPRLPENMRMLLGEQSCKSKQHVRISQNVFLSSKDNFIRGYAFLVRRTLSGDILQ